MQNGTARNEHYAGLLDPAIAGDPAVGQTLERDGGPSGTPRSS